MTSEPHADEPVEEAHISLFDGVVLAIRSADGFIWLAIRDLATTVHVNPDSQLRRIRSHPLLQGYVRRFRVATPGGKQDRDFYQLEGIGSWVMTINSAKASPLVRERLLWLQRHLDQVVRREFAAMTGLPERSNEIEDLDDLRRITPMLEGLAQQQRTLSADQADLRASVDALAARLAALEIEGASLARSISKVQRGVLFHLVTEWAAVLQSRNEGMTIGGARAACWTALKKKFQVAAYEHIPATRYNEAVRFIRDAYTKLGGGDLPAQLGMDLGDSDVT